MLDVIIAWLMRPASQMDSDLQLMTLDQPSSTSHSLAEGSSATGPETEGAPGLGAAPEMQASSGSWRSVLREIVETIVLTLVIFLLIRTVVQNFRVDGMSMEPNFEDGQFLLINKLAYRLGDPQRGDVVVFHYPRDPSRDFIKRIMALPGETIEIIDGQVFINDAPAPELARIEPASYSSGPFSLAPDEIFVMGDNRPNSSDSHTWGPLALDLVVGEVVLSYWPPDTWGLIRTPAPGETTASADQQ